MQNKEKNVLAYVIVFQVDNIFEFSSECLNLLKVYKGVILIF